MRSGIRSEKLRGVIMKVRDASPGDILVAKGLKPKSYTKNLSPHELMVCGKSGFIPGFLMPEWIGNSTSKTGQLEPLLYLGPVTLDEFISGLKKHHIFLYEGRRIGLMGYDFRHLEPVSSV